MKAEYNDKIEQLYLEMYHKLLTYALCALGNQSLAEEAVQECFRIACSKPEAVCQSPNPEGWLVMVLKNVISNMQRSRKAAKKIMTDYISSRVQEFSVSEDRIAFELLYENVAELEEFKLIREMVIDEKSQLEMAKERGIVLNACKKRVQRAKEVLRKKIRL